MRLGTKISGIVAQEVKTLATQTAKATDDIAQQIGSIQGSSHEAVGAIQAIAATMAEIDTYAQSIATAITQQSAAMGEISGSVGQAAAGARQVAEDVQAVNGAVSTSTRAAQETAASASGVARRGQDLQRAVDRFLSDVAAA